MADTEEEDATIRNFRIVQKDYTIKGWVMDDERLKNIVSFRTDYLCLTLISTCWNRKKMRRNRA